MSPSDDTARGPSKSPPVDPAPMDTVDSRPVDGKDVEPIAGSQRLKRRVRDSWPELTTAERIAAQHMISQPPTSLLFTSAQELGRGSGTSNATVVRTLQRLGYEGLPDLKRDLASATPREK